MWDWLAAWQLKKSPVGTFITIREGRVSAGPRRDVTKDVDRGREECYQTEFSIDSLENRGEGPDRKENDDNVFHGARLEDIFMVRPPFIETNGRRKALGGPR